MELLSDSAALRLDRKSHCPKSTSLTAGLLVHASPAHTPLNLISLRPTFVDADVIIKIIK